MTRKEIMELIDNLSKSQGFYGRIKRQIEELTDYERECLFLSWESLNFKDSLDFILYLEC